MPPELVDEGGPWPRGWHDARRRCEQLVLLPGFLVTIIAGDAGEHRPELVGEQHRSVAPTSDVRRSTSSGE